MALNASPLCRSLLGEDGLRDMADVITQAAQMSERLGFVQRPFWEIRHLGWSACGYPTLEVRIGIRAADETDITSLPCDLTFVVSADITWKRSLSVAESRLFLVGDILWTARELIELGRNDVPGLKATRRWIERKEQELGIAS